MSIIRIRGIIAAAFIVALASTASAQPISEGFENVASLAGQGWVFINNSIDATSVIWEQGDTGALGFSAQAGTPDSYAVASWEAVGSFSPTTVLSNYLILPTRTLNNGDELRFWTRKVEPPPDFPDRMQVRMSLNGASTDVGGTVNPDGTGGIGDFTELLLDINPTQQPSHLGGYPIEWTEFVVTLSGLPGPTSGRLAFRHFLINTDINADVIGIDSVLYTPVPEPTSLALAGVVSLVGWRWRRRVRQRASQ